MLHHPCAGGAYSLEALLPAAQGCCRNPAVYVLALLPTHAGHELWAEMMRLGHMSPITASMLAGCGAGGLLHGAARIARRGPFGAQA